MFIEFVIENQCFRLIVTCLSLRLCENSANLYVMTKKGICMNFDGFGYVRFNSRKPVCNNQKTIRDKPKKWN